MRGTCDILYRNSLICFLFSLKCVVFEFINSLTKYKYERRFSLVCGKYQIEVPPRSFSHFDTFVKYLVLVSFSTAVTLQLFRIACENPYLIPEWPSHWYACNDVSWAKPACSWILNTLWLHCLICFWVILRTYIHIIFIYFMFILYFVLFYIILYYPPTSPVKMKCTVALECTISVRAWRFVWLNKCSLSSAYFHLFLTCTLTNCHQLSLNLGREPQNTNKRGQKYRHT